LGSKAGNVGSRLLFIMEWKYDRWAVCLDFDVNTGGAASSWSFDVNIGNTA
jgi:hypothetical protein